MKDVIECWQCGHKCTGEVCTRCHTILRDDLDHWEYVQDLELSLRDLNQEIRSGLITGSEVALLIIGAGTVASLAGYTVIHTWLGVPLIIVVAMFRAMLALRDMP